jgi:hypothetical protein
MRSLTTLLLLSVPSTAAAVCVDWEATGKFADIEAASVVFEGVVERIEPGDVATCAPERVVFRVDRLWKGRSATHYILLQDNGGRITERTPDGGMTNGGCPMWVESDRFTTAEVRYIVFASGPYDGLGAMGCGTSKAPTQRERQRLDKWKAAQGAKRK